jgi:hypothetical protein
LLLMTPLVPILWDGVPSSSFIEDSSSAFLSWLMINLRKKQVFLWKQEEYSDFQERCLGIRRLSSVISVPLS